MLRWVGTVAVAATFVWLWWAGDRGGARRKTSDRTDFTALLAVWRERTEAAFPDQGTMARELSLPRDHTAHPAAPAERWEVLAGLQSEGRRYVLRIAMDRLAASPAAPERRSRWGAHEFYRSTLSFGELGDPQSLAFERFGRGALGLSGHTAAPPAVWVDGDRLEWLPNGAGSDRLEVTIREPRIAGDLRLVPRKPPVSPQQGVPVSSRWQSYAVPRSEVSGTLIVYGRAMTVSGTGWLVHTWGAVPPVGGQIAFERWTLLLDNGSELALFGMRRRDGSGAATRQGYRVRADGSVDIVYPDAMDLQPGGGESGRWVLQIAPPAVDLRLSAPARDARQTETSARAIEVEGRVDGEKISGWGYLAVEGE